MLKLSGRLVGTATIFGLIGLLWLNQAPMPEQGSSELKELRAYLVSLEEQIGETDAPAR